MPEGNTTSLHILPVPLRFFYSRLKGLPKPTLLKTMRQVFGSDQGKCLRKDVVPSRDPLDTLLGTSPLLTPSPIASHPSDWDSRQTPRGTDRQDLFMSSACLQSPGILQLSLEPLAKPRGQEVSAGAGGAGSCCRGGDQEEGGGPWQVMDVAHSRCPS